MPTSTPDPFSRPYWDAAAEGRLLLRRCRDCGRPHHHPREFCPYCWSEDVEWEEASGRATLYTWSVVHRSELPGFRERTPYVVGVVDLAEGPRMATEIVECATEIVGSAAEAVGCATEAVGCATEATRCVAEGLRAGLELEVDFREGVPVFKVRGDNGRGLA
ncbi:Zn-ribbon domain-containing OB-fold protein [Streptomyces sp. NPDC096205]|uniref:Zn-ribbon domain-containing OB-fold protein n=1 Tax=Streptomyces sp. NPDC096205 TaxID=3366081 RepID=UPI00381F9389